VTATKTIATSQAVTTPASGCSSAPFKVTVDDQRIIPTVSFAPIASTSCDTNYDGKITVTAVTAAPVSQPGVSTSNYNFVWTGKPAGMTITDALNTPSAAVFSSEALGGPVNERIGPGTYLITVTNTTNNCPVNGSVDVQQNTVLVEVIAATGLPLTNCGPADGSVTVNTVNVGGVSQALHPTFTFGWTGPGGPYGDLLTVPNLTSGDYFVTATKTIATSQAVTTPASGCSSAPFKVTVDDQRIIPTVSFAPIASTSCDTNYDGKITVTAVTAAPVSQPGVSTSNYNFVWTGKPVGMTITDALNTPSAAVFSSEALGGPVNERIGPGTYLITVTNTTNNCPVSGSVDIDQNTVPFIVSNTVTTDRNNCVLLNGSAGVTQLTLNGSTKNGAVLGTDYSYVWKDNTSTTVSTNQNTGTILDFGTYTVVATKSIAAPQTATTPASGCSTAPFPVIIKDIRTYPVVAGLSSADVNCAGGAGGGSITLSSPLPPANFTYVYHIGDDFAAGSNISTIGGTTGGGSNQNALTLQEGDYTVRVTEITTSCSTDESFTVVNNPTIVDFDPAGFTAPAVTTCNLATGVPSNGTATVTSILENNISQPLTNYAFTWTDATNNVLPNSPLPTLVGVSPGTYFVKATNTVSNCIANHSFTIDDKTLGSTVTLISFAQPEKCVNPTTGFLTAQGGGTWPGPFTYEWYAGDLRPSPSGPPLVVGPTVSNIPIAPNQIYTIKTINSNNCWVVDAYSIPLIVNPVVITTSTNPLTFCTSNNGEAFSTIANDNKFDYNFMWGIGNTVNPPVDYTTSDVKGLPAGNYTVVAVDKLDPGCFSPTVTVTVDNMQNFPVVTARVLKPLTICDPARPNGVASADVAGDFVHYTFDWYAGNSATGTSFYTGAVVGNLAATNYTVVGIETATGCSTPATISVPTNFAVIPAPTVTTVSNVTSCISDNGILSATVGGVTKDYIFDWRNGSNAPPPIDFTGEIYTDLSVGNYTVIATSRITGCVSSPTTTPITNEQKFPVFEFLVQDATCTIADGFITILVTDDVFIDKVTWYQGGAFVATGPNLENANAGTYQVTLRTVLGCETTENVNLPANINPFNGVSKLADGKNDFFVIDCIEQYPQNHVEIFNRAGTKVYEADGYNNMDVLFDGKSNRGISIMGTNLPAGTYYYVISKGDGSKRTVGYLELVD